MSSADARDWHSVVAASDPFDHPGLLSDPIEEVLAWLPDGTPSERREMYLAREGGKAVGAAKLRLPMADNTKAAHLDITVQPGDRRRGIGRRLFEEMRARATEFGRETIDGLVGGPLDEDSPGTYFAAALGATETLAKIRYQLTLGALDEDSLHALEKDAEAHSHEYGLVQWVDRAPEQYLDDWASLEARVTSDSPHGELAVEDGRWDGARCREWEDQTIARKRARLVTGARHLQTDHLVAISHLAISRSRPTLADQWGTIVSPEHRGHRLGKRIKIANLRYLLRAFPTCETITTFNALDNSYMRAVNEAIGFREAERYATWQLKVDVKPGANRLIAPKFPPVTDGVVTLRPPYPGDAELLIAGRDDGFCRWIGPGADEPDPIACVLVDNDIVGWMDYDPERDWLSPGEINVGYYLFPQYRGNGYATRALKLFIRQLALYTDHHTATLLIAADNLRSIRLAERANFERAADVSNHRFFKRALRPRLS